MPDPKPPSVVLPGLVALAVLCGAYAATYYWGVVQNEENDIHANAVMTEMYPKFHGRLPARLDDDDAMNAFVTSFGRWKRFFAPMHWLDRRIRPHVWEPKP